MYAIEQEMRAILLWLASTLAYDVGERLVVLLRKKEAPAKQPAGSEEDDAKGAAVGDAGVDNTGSSDADSNTDSEADSDKDDDAGASGDAKEDELDELREYAEALGIEVKKNWGIAKLKKEIAAAETN